MFRRSMKARIEHSGPSSKFFDDDAGAGFAEGFVPHDLIDGGHGIRRAIANGHAFPLGQAGGFDHHRLILHLDVFLRLLHDR